MEKIALIGQGGGARNAFCAGVGIGAKLTSDKFDACFAVSSAFGNAVYFISGQTHLASHLWIDELTSPEIFCVKRTLKGKFPANMDHMVDVSCCSLDTDALFRSRTKLYGAVVQWRDGKTLYPKATRENIRSLFKATCSIPYVSKPVVFENEKCVDGGITDPMPIVHAYEQGFKKLLVLSHRPKGKEVERLGAPSMGAFGVFPGLRSAVLERRRLGKATRDFIDCPPKDAKLLIINAPHELPCTRFDRNKAHVKAALELGIEVGIKKRSEIEAFFQV